MLPTAKLTLEQALHNIKIVLEQHKGTLQEHMSLQESLKVIKEELEKGAIQPGKQEINTQNPNS